MKQTRKKTMHQTSEIIKKLSRDVRSLGGSDDHLGRILTDKKLRRQIAKLLVPSTGPKTLAEMIAACGFDYTNDEITEKKFPVDPKRFTTEGSKLFHFEGFNDKYASFFDRGMTSKRVKAEIRKEGYEPASIEHLLAFAKENPDRQRFYPIVCLGSCWMRDIDYPVFPSLYVWSQNRGVALLVGNGEWSDITRFLAVRRQRRSRAAL